MRTVIAGGREKPPGNVYGYTLDSMYELLRTAITGSKFLISEVVCGGATGVDHLGYRWACQSGVPVRLFLPDWQRYGTRYAPIKRNSDMAANADALIAIWNGESRGTANMIEAARGLGLRTYILRIPSQESLIA